MSEQGKITSVIFVQREVKSVAFWKKMLHICSNTIRFTKLNGLR